VYQAHYASQISLPEMAQQLGALVSRINCIVSAPRGWVEAARQDEL